MNWFMAEKTGYNISPQTTAKISASSFCCCVLQFLLFGSGPPFFLLEKLNLKMKTNDVISKHILSVYSLHIYLLFCKIYFDLGFITFIQPNDMFFNLTFILSP